LAPETLHDVNRLLLYERKDSDVRNVAGSEGSLLQAALSSPVAAYSKSGVADCPHRAFNRAAQNAPSDIRFAKDGNSSPRRFGLWRVVRIETGMSQ